MKFKDGSEITSSNGGTLITKGEAMDIYNLIWLKTYLPFEIRTGIMASRHATALDVARATAGIRFKNRKQALAWLDTIQLPEAN